MIPEERLSSKGLRAKRSLVATNAEVINIKEHLKIVSNILKKMEEISNDSRPNKESQTKKRSMVSDLPSRLEFSQNGLILYIDFTISPARDGSEQDVEGAIIYGTSRTLCFELCIQPGCNKQGCQRIGRCDGLEDKPLLKIMIDGHGAIKSEELEDEWRLSCKNHEPENAESQAGEDDKDKIDEADGKILAEIHYRAVEKIWRDALDWTNENLLP